MQRELKTTSDGSSTLHIPEWNESYHSTHGALQEAQHIFIQNGLHKISKPEISIVEFGFGTGLNAFLSCIESSTISKKIHYLGIEKHPVNFNELALLNYNKLIKDPNDYLGKMHRIPWGEYFAIDSHFYLKKVQTDFREIEFSQTIDLVFYDAFGFRVQPYLWDKRIFQNIYNNLNINGLLTTYCSKGVVRRTLEEIGFTVEKLAGPSGKREMINAWKK